MTEPSLAVWLERLETLHPVAIELGLERVRTVAARLQLLPVAVPVITVAGTNGKGSTVAVLEALVADAGLVAGVYTSPHLQFFNERIRVAGTNVDDSSLCDALAQIDAARGEISLSYFEFATLAALLVFRSRGVDITVLEVGLGGRLDAVNIVDPTVAVITSIALDHQAWLGDSLDAIAREKAGILRASAPAVIADSSPTAGLYAAVSAAGARAVWLNEDFGFEEQSGDRWQGYLQTADGDRRQLPSIASSGLLPANICAALQALELLGLPASDKALARVVPTLQLRGRRQQLRVGDIDYVLDVAHNPAAVNKLGEFLSAKPCKGKTISLFSAMADKDISGMIKAAGDHFEAWFVADQPTNPRAATAADIATALRQNGQQMISVSKNLRQALARARSVMAVGDRLVVFGSFFTVAAVLSSLDKQAHGYDQ
ncbi:bifunctional folylpolyglutamate synthase/dihydrofolate synthase [Kineobactrum sediminis]|uniref:Dihydrofolate synthase/folylpolyglutamate synthase n=1 Tax=Kineobactrum sediminis TaxID=1905677 RepID=A0A2N5Y2W1_9GAMM|nr:folylpolyglutamate synthase/dihydrofolate synthase family protein [Kineobactrum sediminis]PLW82734.1 bifunctional folylpolyglutamate synthase/dihydrofolate synthase [Kineobactrum sediminis]